MDITTEKGYILGQPNRRNDQYAGSLGTREKMDMGIRVESLSIQVASVQNRQGEIRVDMDTEDYLPRSTVFALHLLCSLHL